MNVIDKLIRLQEIDSQIFRLKAQLAEIPLQLEEGQRQCAAAIAQVKLREEQLKAVQIRHKALDLDLQQREQQIAKQELQKFQVKTNKECAALQLEIDAARADNSFLEEDIIRALETIDEIKATIETEKKQLVQAQARWDEHRKALAGQQLDLEQRLAVQGVQRQEVLKAGVPPVVIERYERILAHTGELAIVPVQNDTCQGCSMKVRPQIVSELQLGKMHTCDSCARLLYVTSE